MNRLTAEERHELVQRARWAAAHELGAPASGPSPSPPSGRLAEPGAAFVTWKKAGRLRGCIGSVEARRPLALDVEANAVSALVHDPRFPPVTARDYAGLSVEISVLTPFETISGPEEIEIGVHGVWVEKGSRRGLLLPQVASEWGWNAEQLLEQVCYKAGLPGDAWRPGPQQARLYRFTAEVFAEA